MTQGAVSCPVDADSKEHSCLELLLSLDTLSWRCSRWRCGWVF